METINYKIGQTLIVDLKSESFIGKLQFINKKRTRIILVNVSNFKTKEKIDGPQYFFVSDIASIITEDNADDDTIDNAINSSSNDDTISNNELLSLSLNSSDHKEENNRILRPAAATNQKLPIYRKRINIKINEYAKIDHSVQNVKYISQTDCSYHNALKDINNQKEISLCIESCRFGRNDEPTTLITIYSPSNNIVYIFDILFFGQIYPEMKSFIENPNLLKVIYDGRIIFDHFQYKHNINIPAKIFDCLASHFNISRSYNEIDVLECIQTYINIPQSYLYDKIEDLNGAWHSRPLKNSLKILAAQKVIFLYKLYEIHNRILHERMLAKFSEACQIFGTSYSSNKNFIEVASQMAGKNSDAAIKIAETNLDISLEDNELVY